jgi:MFS family permease
VSAVPLRRNRDFLLFQAGQLLSDAGTQMTSIAYPLLVLAVTGSAAKAGVVAFARTLPWVLFTLPAGVAADRWNRRRLTIAADGVRVLAVGGLAAAILPNYRG